MPAPPTYDPAAMAAQYSAPPVSGPYGYAPMPPPPAKKGVATVVLSVLTAIFVLASGALGTLFVMKNREASNLSGQVTQLNTTVASTEKELETTKRNLKDSDDELKEVTSERKAMADCLNGIYDFWDALDAANGQDTPATDAAADEADRLCDIADKYLARR
jgi:septal ring factor EnvC (AmiA/AmiB activator)